MKRKIDFITKDTYSKDGTRISYTQCGTGPGIIVLPGALATANDFAAVARALSDYFTVYTINRRGRVGSGEQGAQYSIQKELEDVAAVQSITNATNIFGHSFGGFIALEYARDNSDIKKVIVYEPGVSVGNSISMDWAVRSKQYLDRDQPLDAFVEFVRAMNPDSAKAPRWLLKRMLPMFIKKAELQQKYALLPGTIREHAEEARLTDTHHTYKQIAADALLMRGGKENATTAAFDAMVRDITRFSAMTFKELDHFGPEKKPAVIADHIQRFALKS